MRAFRGINWIADSIPVAPSESEAKWVTTNQKRIWLASLMRREYPLSTPMLARGSSDISFTSGNTLVLATHPRPYEQWIYDSLKSDIIVVAKTSERQEAEARLEKEKLLALQWKTQLKAKLKQITATLSEMHSKGLIDAAVGRGSYFNVNGYPSEHDDVDIILLKKRNPKEPKQLDSIKIGIRDAIASSKGNFGANIVDFNENIVKKPHSRDDTMFSFIILPTDYKGLGLYYEKYVLRTCVGIGIRGIMAAKSESLARGMLKHIGVDEREKLINEGKLSIFPKKRD